LKGGVTPLFDRYHSFTIVGISVILYFKHIWLSSNYRQWIRYKL